MKQTLFGRLALSVAPVWSARREQARLIAMNYRAARLGAMSDSLRASRDNADRAAARRDQIAAYTRDIIRNTPFATRGQAVIANNVVGDGIIPKIEVRGSLPEKMKARIRAHGMEWVEDHLDTVAIDQLGVQNLYGLQRLMVNAIVADGEVLVRRHVPANPGPGELPLRLEVLEADYLDGSRYGSLTNGGQVMDGIEYDAQGRRVAYWLFTSHPGGDWIPGKSALQSERVPAEDVLHIFRQDRPGQNRGVSWFAPVAERLMSFDDYEDAQMMRQKIASCFTAFRKIGAEGVAQKIDLNRSLEPGIIMDIGPDDEMQFAAPPEVGGYDEFTGKVLRAAAMGLGITYEALTGDLTGVNFSSARIGRLEMDRNVSAWQWLMMVPMCLQPLGRWITEAWASVDPDLWDLGDPESLIRFTWVPPVRILVDPAREISALREAVRSGFQSRQGVVRQLGVDPERLLAEQLQDKEEADRLGLPFDSDPRADVSRQNKSATDPDREEQGP